MQIQLKTEADLAAARIVALAPDCKIAKLVATLAETQCPAKENFTAVISTQLLPFTYRTNPSLFSRTVLAHATSFRDAGGGGGSRSIYSPTEITVTLLREPRPREGISRNWNQGNKISLKQQVKQILNHPPGSKLTVPHSHIPTFLLTHPEQLTYQIFRETGQRIKIIKHKTKWTITLK